jgi:ParB-like chromosome segregation protein Spo0J
MIGFDEQMITLKLEQIASVKKLTAGIQYTEKFRQIMASIKVVGIVEPPVVIADKHNKDKYFLLDGHLRIEAIKTIGVDEVCCLISMDDEAYTYNRHINRLSTIQEHNMILRAIERGVSEDKIAAALNVNIGSILNNQNVSSLLFVRRQ